MIVTNDNRRTSPIELGDHEGIITDTCDCPCHINCTFTPTIACPEGCQPDFDGVIFRKDRAVCVAGETFMLYDKREE